MVSVVNSNNISGLIQRTLNHVDSRLVDHGKRVAYLVSRMLDTDGTFTSKERQDICFLALLHDVGAYKTEEINEMAKFETEDIWEHSIYGYLFLYHLSPLKDWAEVVLYHHVSADGLAGVEKKIARVSQLLNLADRVDMFWLHNPNEAALVHYLDKNRGRRFQNEVVDLFFETEEREHLIGDINGEPALQSILSDVTLSVQECEKYLKMMIYAIDFRSQHTVTHTITTTSISTSTARILGMSEEQIRQIYYGALLHDLGKIGIPVEILEFPGKLSPQAMNIMRTHVNITEEILGGTIDPAITKIAIRHHEKLDGSGYPRGLEANELTLEEQVVAVSDIISALLGTRSYKEAYSKAKTLAILDEQASGGKINADIVAILKTHFDEILTEVTENCTPILHTYYGLQKEYELLLEKHRSNDIIR